MSSLGPLVAVPVEVVALSLSSPEDALAEASLPEAVAEAEAEADAEAESFPVALAVLAPSLELEPPQAINGVAKLKQRNFDRIATPSSCRLFVRPVCFSVIGDRWPPSWPFSTCRAAGATRVRGTRPQRPA